ncbi:MAG: hypothetical protein OEV64_12480 [Desulfobulbaceae bacterium]|nr:hypothetical protein [Desulfobulbaceae bacterium]
MKQFVYLPFLLGCAIFVYYFAKRARLRGGRKKNYDELLQLPPVIMDFNTPEGAILCLEEAYRQGDRDGVLAAKDFVTEARLMLERAGLHDKIDEEMLGKASATLVDSFKSHLAKKWPDFKGVESFFLRREVYCDKVVVVTEACRLSNGEFSQQRILVSETEQGWRVLNPEESK